MSSADSVREARPRLAAVLRAWLVEPSAAVTGTVRRRQARLLSTLILATLLLLTGLAAGYTLTVPGYRLPEAHRLGVFIWAGLYALSRLGQMRLTLTLLLPIFPLMAVMTVVRGTELDLASTLSYLIPSYVLAGVFLSPRGVAFYGYGTSLIMLLLPLIAPARVHGFSQIVGPVGAGAITVTLTIIAQIYRDRIEGDREAGLKGAYNSTLEGWARALELRDKDTEGHSRRVAALAVRLASASGLKGEDLESVYRGALLHDIGKMALPDSILLKHGDLNPQEEQIMRTHPRVAMDLLSPTSFLRPAMDIPAYHHEWWDGSGYPYGLRGEEIPLAARIFVVVDTWDALTSDRSYRKAWSRERVIQHLGQHSGTQFDPRIVRRFLELIA